MPTVPCTARVEDRLHDAQKSASPTTTDNPPATMTAWTTAGDGIDSRASYPSQHVEMTSMPDSSGTRRRRNRRPGDVLREIRVGARWIALTLHSHEVGPTVLLGARSSNRRVAFVDADLVTLRLRMRPVGATVNDALLAAVASGFRAMLPVAGERFQPGCRFRFRLHCSGAAHPATRSGLCWCGCRSASRPQLPGPAGALTLAGAPVVAIWPVAVLAGNVRLGVAALSCQGRLNCGIHFDAGSLPGDVFVDGFREELARWSS
ncbi:WS/DGAT domain-containing protein [Parafrigoribacterium mesophilum]|uniref:WS/DGAT domain-containing protein n=1 Tax=Parafrigoribacterium mesophilum TaxID=433646 RepID=UPI0031FE2283